MRIPRTWGATPEECSREYPCDHRCPRHDAAYFRAVTIRARPDAVFRWLCQLRVAPYSYDWIDHFGRRSPRALTPGLERLEVGQTVMQIFELAAFEPARSLTLVNKARRGARGLFGEVWVSYVVAPTSDDACRLLAKVLVRYPGGPWGVLMRIVLPPGDLIMMRRQLLNLKALSERHGATNVR
jgi:hypothetical protein